jgi:hypothetical protein
VAHCQGLHQEPQRFGKDVGQAMNYMNKTTNIILLITIIYGT